MADAVVAADAADALGAPAPAAAAAAVAAGQSDVAAPAKAEARSDHVQRYKLLRPGPLDPAHSAFFVACLACGAAAGANNVDKRRYAG